jgi:hypothetical protein
MNDVAKFRERSSQSFATGFASLRARTRSHDTLRRIEVIARLRGPGAGLTTAAC